MKYKIPVAAVTGGIGSGKSTVMKIFKDSGSFVIDSDRLAKDLLWKNDQIHRKVIDAFGAGICGEPGKIDKKLLTGLVFSDEKSIRKLNNIIHPAVVEEIQNRISVVENSGSFPAVFVEAALIFEAGIEDNFDYVIVVTAEENTRINRIINRDNVTAEDVLDRMKHQIDPEILIGKSDYAIYNNGAVEELKEQAVRVYKKILQKAPL